MAAGLYFIALLCLTRGLWAAANAEEKLQSVIAEEEDDCCVRCPSGWTQLEDKCYIFHFSPKEWVDAEVSCIGIGGNLASVHSKEQLTFIQEMIKRSTGSFAQTWLGGYNAVKESVWQWSDGSAFNHKFWAPGEPNNSGGVERCMGIALSGHGNDMKCQVKNSYICGKRL